jgi:alkylation response protein AidB-like acyl-CoA dehydrogenase
MNAEAQSDLGRADPTLDRIRALAERFARARPLRQARRELCREDFDALAEAGFLRSALPRSHGGSWIDPASSTRSICEIVEALAGADASVALVAAMHPTALLSAGWLAPGEAGSEAWCAQRSQVLRTLRDGHFWGVIASEPGTGGDLERTKARATPAGADAPFGAVYLVSGQKHFGTGSGICSFMITCAVPEGEPAVADFFMDWRGAPLDGTGGLRLVAPWDGHGMLASQSHAVALEAFPAYRIVEPPVQQVSAAVDCIFTSVFVGIVEVAVATARERLAAVGHSMSAYDKTEWTRIEIESWLIRQAHEGMLREVESGAPRPRGALIGMTAVAELAPSVLERVTRVIGGGSYSRSSPFGHWLEDVRALGFLRPPWALAYSRIFDRAWGGRGGAL